MPTQNDVRDFFFLAMCSCSWAQGAEGKNVPNYPGWKQLSFRDKSPNGLVLVDRWGKDSLGRPTGSTLITKHGVPVWVMTYGEGSYPKQSLPVLRSALMDCYRLGQFCGGRGPTRFVKGGYSYHNSYVGNFNRFSGKEMVFMGDGTAPLGYHTYWGGSLLDRDID